MDKASEMLIFTRSVDEGGFSAAARSLELTPSAVSKQVNRLEDRLGVRLLNRTTRRLSLTEEGRAFYERCKAILDDIEEAERLISNAQHTPRGTLRVNAPFALGRRQLVPLLPAFMNRYPQVRIELELNDRTVNILEEEIDVLIRGATELHDSSHIARRLATARRFICAAPSYLEKYGVPQTPEDLRRHNCLMLSHPSGLNDWVLQGSDGPRVIHVSGNFASNFTDVLHAAALAGVGLARLSTIIIGEDIKQGRLSPVLTDYTRDFASIYAIYPHRRHLSPKVRAFVDFLRDAFDPPPWQTPVCQQRSRQTAYTTEAV